MNARTLLVTGASRGIGRAICERLLAQGHKVVGLAREFPPSDKPDALFHPCSVDLADLRALPDRLAALARAHPDIDAVVCNAGRGEFGSLEEFSYRQIAGLMELNFTAQAFVVRAFLPAMKQRRQGDLIFIGSEAALWGGRRGAVYSASKAALRGFAQALREECARSGVRVCTVNPGMVRTGFFDGLGFEPGDDTANAIRPDDVAAAVCHVLAAPPGTVFDEINLSPLKKVLRFRR